MLLCFDDEQELATRLARELGRPLGVIARHRFPDGEVRLVLPKPLPSDIIVLRGLQHQPNDRLVELLIAAPAARGWGVKYLMLVVPYLAYMRQDMEFTPGEAVSQRHVAALLSAQFDRVVTVDPHLHRIASLDEVMPPGRGVALSAAALLGRFIAGQVPGAVLVGPDEESAQWVAQEEWHPQQQLKPQADGSLRMRIPYSEPTELVMDVLRHGPNVRVVSPPELAQLVRDQLRETLAAYEDAASDA